MSIIFKMTNGSIFPVEHTRPSSVPDDNATLLARLTADTAHMAKSYGFFRNVPKVAEHAKLAAADWAFSTGGDVMVLPLLRAPNAPTPNDIFNPKDDTYSRFIFNRTNFHRVLSPDDEAAYEGDLGPAARWKFLAPFRTCVLPWVASKGKKKWVPAADAHNFVTMFLFRRPAVFVAKDRAPVNAAGPFELKQGRRERIVVAHTKSMTPTQLAKLAELTATEYAPEAWE